MAGLADHAAELGRKDRSDGSGNLLSGLQDYDLSVAGLSKRLENYHGSIYGYVARDGSHALG